MRHASVGAVVAVLLLAGCTSSDECGPGADCPKTVTVGQERYQVGCLPGGVREPVLEERVEDVAYGPAERFDTVTVEAREIRGVEVSEAVAIRIFGEGRSCGYDDESVWSWATAPQLPSERIEEIAGAISAGSRYTGVTTDAPASGPQGSDRWKVTVRLDDQRVASSDVVQVAFDEDELWCSDGSTLPPSELRAGQSLSFVRVGAGAEPMDPPIIAGEELWADC